AAAARKEGLVLIEIPRPAHNGIGSALAVDDLARGTPYSFRRLAAVPWSICQMRNEHRQRAIYARLLASTKGLCGPVIVDLSARCSADLSPSVRIDPGRWRRARSGGRQPMETLRRRIPQSFSRAAYAHTSRRPAHPGWGSTRVSFRSQECGR